MRAEADSAAVAELVRDAEQRAARAEHDRAVARVEADKLRDELARLREEAGPAARGGPRARPQALREAQAARAQGQPSCSPPRRAGPPGPPPTTTPSCAGCGPSWPRPRPPPAAPGRRAKEARAVDDARLWLLLETIGQAAVGLRRELALEPADELPADFVADAARRPARARRARPAPARWTPTTRPGSTSCSPCPGRT